jgi:hypothetical protein
MGFDVENERVTAHGMIDQLDPGQLSAVVKLLQVMLPDAMAQTLARAPEDDEPETENERRAVEAARAEPGPGTPHDEVLKEFGL